MLKVSILVGNPNPGSRTLTVAETLVKALLAPGTYEITAIDLVDYAGELFAWPSEQMSALNASVAECDLLVVASPTYKASYTGLLKAFLDRYGQNGLAGVTAIPVMTGALATHSLAPEVHLRPLLVELAASVPTKGLYFLTTEMERLDEIVGAFAQESAETLRRIPAIAESLQDTTIPVTEGAAS